MSIERTTLDDYAEPDTPTFEGARYDRPDPTTEAPEPQDVNPGVCQNCDRHASLHYRRINGDRDDVLWHCADCLTMSDMLRGAGAHPDYEARLPDHHTRGGSQ